MFTAMYSYILYDNTFSNYCVKKECKHNAQDMLLLFGYHPHMQLLCIDCQQIMHGG